MFIRQISSTEVKIDAPAKVNLFLQVLNRRADGYHNINSLFQAVSLFDKLHFDLSQNPDISIKLVNKVDLTVSTDNLIAKAYRMMKDQFGLKKGLSVTLEKKIPTAAGLGGGSADAAATILACNLLFNLNQSYHQMAQVALKVGSDLPFFFSSGQALVTGRGECVVDIDLPLDYTLVLVTADLAIATKAAYAALKMDLTKPKRPFKLKSFRTVGELVTSLHRSGNDFEKVQLTSYPELSRIKESLLKRGALLVRMSGSGPTMFGIFGFPSKVNVAECSNEESWRYYTVKPITLPGEQQLRKAQ